MTKNEKIKEDWLKHVSEEDFNQDLEKGLIDDDGWIRNCIGSKSPNKTFNLYGLSDEHNNIFDCKVNEKWHSFIRPKSLNNIETNNFWTIIDEFESNLPLYDCNVKLRYNDKTILGSYESKLGFRYGAGEVIKPTHYKIIDMLDEPLY